MFSCYLKFVHTIRIYIGRTGPATLKLSTASCPDVKNNYSTHNLIILHTHIYIYISTLSLSRARTCP